MSTTVNLQASRLDDYFVYDVNNPTRYTEHLSYTIGCILADLADGGLKFLIDTSIEGTPDNSSEIVSNWLTEWGAWLKEVSTGVGSFLSEKEGSRGAFLIPAAPLLPALPSLLPAIGIGLAVKIATDIASNITESYANFQQVTRYNRLERVLDKSLNEETYFGLGKDKSLLGEIKKQLEELNKKLEYKEGGKTQNISEITKKALTQLFLEVVVDRANTLESVTFEGVKS